MATANHENHRLPSSERQTREIVIEITYCFEVDVELQVYRIGPPRWSRGGYIIRKDLGDRRPVDFEDRLEDLCGMTSQPELAAEHLGSVHR